MREILLKNFPSYIEAEAAKGLLAQYGVRSMLQKGSTAAMSDFSGFGGGDADLFVAEKDCAKVREILGEEEKE